MNPGGRVHRLTCPGRTLLPHPIHRNTFSHKLWKERMLLLKRYLPLLSPGPCRRSDPDMTECQEGFACACSAYCKHSRVRMMTRESIFENPITNCVVERCKFEMPVSSSVYQHFPSVRTSLIRRGKHLTTDRGRHQPSTLPSGIQYVVSAPRKFTKKVNHER